MTIEHENEIIAEAKAEVLDKATETFAPGRAWGVVIPVLLKRINDLEQQIK